jgi:predicted dehydrogenase
VNDSPIGVLIVGAGFIADAHIIALASSSRAAAVGVVDADGARAAAFAHSHGGLRYGVDLVEALAWDGVDAVIVCTPNDTHRSIGEQVAAAGKHLLVEKPLTTDVTDARAVLDAFEAAGTTVMAAHTHRAYDYGRSVKEAIEADAIGRPVQVRLAILGGWIWPDWNAWVLDPERSGGHALHNGVHLLDLASWWIGDAPLSVMARGAKQTASALPIYDYLEMVVTYAGGATAICEMSRAHRPTSISHRDVLVLGTGGVLSHGWDDEGVLLIDDKGTAVVAAQGANGFAVQLESWLDAIEGGLPMMTAEDALLAVALGVAVERSIESGKRVELADVLGGASLEVAR